MEFIQKNRIFGVVRTESAEAAKEAAKAAIAGGIKLIEIALTIPDALDVIKEFQNREDVLVGAGSVVDEQMTLDAIDAGAKFIVSPHTNLGIVRACKEDGIFVIQGGVTPTEIINLWKSEVDLIKVFPISSFGGPAHIKALLSPFPFLKLIPTGGVSQKNIGEYLRFGAYAVGVAGNLFDKTLIKEGNFTKITEDAEKYVKLVSPM